MPLPPTTPTRQFAGLVLAPIEKQKLGALRDLLERIAGQTTAAMRGQPPPDPILPLFAVQSLHYARLVILEPEDGSEALLAFSTDYDGPEGDDRCGQARARRHHLDDLFRHARPGLEQLFACCRGYQPGQLAAYFQKHDRPSSTFYVGSSGRSRNQILWEAELRRKVDGLLDAGDFSQEPAEGVRRLVRERLAGEQVTIPAFPAQPDFAGKVARAVLALGGVAVALFFAATLAVRAASRYGISWNGARGLPLLWAAVFIFLLLAATTAVTLWRFRRLEASDPQFQPEFSRRTHERVETATRGENQFLQNQLSHVVAVKPGLMRWLLIRVVFAGLQFLARNVYNRGKLGGIPSIHFARWVLIPDRRVLFFSNFDSSWESYLGDFIDQASAGLTAVWSNTIGYPRTSWLLRAGSRDASRFLAWTRHHQVPSQVWYSAYPGLSVANVNANTEIRRGLAPDSDIDAATWLFRLRGVDRLLADQVYSDEQTREPPLPLRQIQGIILRGYGHMEQARYLMFRVERPGPELFDWLGQLPLTSAAEASRLDSAAEPLINVAFSHAGLLALGLDPELCARFSTPFVQGASHEYRARANGDIGEDAPANWAWGSEQNPVHLLLLVYAQEANIQRFADQYTRQAQAAGLALVQILEGRTLPDRKEHFGFRDGIAQPTVQGSGRPEVPGNTVAAGEFLLGHRDGYGNVAHSPVTSDGFAFGTNGSYLVFRQLEQDVHAFWRYCVSQMGGEGALTMASKMVGRWPSGAPLVRHPDRDPDLARFADEDNFSYLLNDEDNDRYGARCPFGAHIRRCNPRDWQLGANPAESLELSNLHRILRRGRPYGPPLVDSLRPAELIAHAITADRDSAGAGQRGLQFLCFNAQIDRQFEFIQQQWCNNPKFGGQNSDADPLLGTRRPPDQLGLDPPAFTLQSDVKAGLGSRALGVQRFVRVVGSAYFFMPSISAVALLRDRHLQHPPPEVGFERPPPDEQVHIDSLIRTLRTKMKKDYANGQTLRDAHPKMHGCVKALFRVEPGLEPALAVGLFARPAAYQAWVRFSNQDGTVSPDAKKDIRGAAVKLMGVAGAKLLDGEEQGTTHDFILISHDAFVTKDVAEFDALIRGMVGGKLRFLSFLLRHPRVIKNLYQSLQRHSSPLGVQYFSVAPYLFGTRAVKYTLTPSGGSASALPPKPYPRDYLREAMKAQLAVSPASFDFMVQFHSGDERKTPIEDPGKPWRVRDARFHKVATLEIMAQPFDDPDQQRFGENLSFNPWRCLPEHAPLGGISRARRQVYRALSGFRHARNAAPNREPASWDLS